MANPTIESVVGSWKEPAFKSSLIDRCRKYWSVPVDQMPDGILAMFIRQRIALELIVPEAKKRIAGDKPDDSELYDGELASALRGADVPPFDLNSD